MNDSSNSGDSTDDESFEEGNSGRTSSSNELLNNGGGATGGTSGTTGSASDSINGTTTINGSPEASIFSALGNINHTGSSGILDTSTGHGFGSQSALSAVSSMGYPHSFRFGPHHPAAQSHHFGQTGIHSLHSSPGHHLADVAPSALVMHHTSASSAETMFQLSAAAAAAASVAANPAAAFDSYSKYGASMAAAVVAFGGRTQF